MSQVVMVEVNVSASPPPPRVTLHAKILVRHLDFYYGQTWAPKNISMPLYANSVTALGHRS